MSSPNVPPPATEPDPIREDTWDPQEFPATISGIVEERETFERKRDGEPFEVLTIRTDDELVRVLCGRKHLAQLVAQDDPLPGDGIAITCFGKNERGMFQYALRVDKSARLGGQGKFDVEPSAAAKVSRQLNQPLQSGDEEAAA